VKFIYFGISYNNPYSPLSLSLLPAPRSLLQAHVLATSLLGVLGHQRQIAPRSNVALPPQLYAAALTQFIPPASTKEPSCTTAPPWRQGG
jgi:hypothetical protein